MTYEAATTSDDNFLLINGSGNAQITTESFNGRHTVLELLSFYPPTNRYTDERFIHSIKVRKMRPERSADSVRVVASVHLTHHNPLILHVFDEVQFLLNVEREEPVGAVSNGWHVGKKLDQEGRAVRLDKTARSAASLKGSFLNRVDLRFRL